jgi:exonuclease SbcD
MRILHTADWHLGRTLHGQSLLEEQRNALKQIEAELAGGYDAIIIAGDVYDRSIPPPDAIDLFGEFLSAVQALGIAILVTPGNHDSAQRLGFAATVLEKAGLFFRCDFKRLDQPVVLEDADGQQVDVFMLPFIESGRIRDQFDDESVVDHYSATERAITEMRKGMKADRPSILVAHAFVDGGRTCESERDLYVGGAGKTSSSLFDGFDYVALGHLHRPHSIGRETIRYSGSPVPYSFSEAEDAKEAVCVELDGEGFSAKSIPLRLLREMVVIDDAFDVVLESDAYEAATEAYVSIRLTDSRHLSETYARLKKRFPYMLELRQPKLEPREDAGSGPRAAVDDPALIMKSFVEEFLVEADHASALKLLLGHLKKAATMEDGEGA